MDDIQEADELVRDYLLFRGFNHTLKAFDADCRTDKEKAFEAKYIVEELFSFIRSHDLNGLQNYWGYLDRRYFSRLEARFTETVKSLETSLLKWYLVHAKQNKKRDNLIEFFDSFGNALAKRGEWKEWFELPFCSRPETHPTFATYLSAAWLETLRVSLYNFLSTIFCHMPHPALLQYPSERIRKRDLERENAHLQSQLEQLKTQLAACDAELSMMKTKDYGLAALSPTSIYAQPSDQQPNSAKADGPAVGTAQHVMKSIAASALGTDVKEIVERDLEANVQAKQ